MELDSVYRGLFLFVKKQTRGAGSLTQDLAWASEREGSRHQAGRPPQAEANVP